MGRQVVQVYLPKKIIEKIDRYATERGHFSRSAATRAMLLELLAQNRGEAEELGPRKDKEEK